MSAPVPVNCAADTGGGDIASPTVRARRGDWALTIGGVALAALLLPSLQRPAPRVVWNVSASVPLGPYRIAPGASVRVGDIVAVRPAPELARFMAYRRYVEADALLIKPVAAAAGQRVCRDGAKVSIDGRVVATALAVDSRYRPLPIWSGCGRLGPGQLFLLARDMPASFDGRYFGPISPSQVVGKATLLWSR